MNAPWKRAAAIGMAAAAVLASSGLAGCKRPVEKADDALTAQLADGQAKLAQNPRDPNVAIPVIQKAGATPNASDAARATANVALAHAEQQAADRLILQAEQKQSDVFRLATLINQQVGRIQANNDLIASYQAREPKKAQDAIAKQSAGAEAGTGDNKVWFAHDAAPVPSLAATKDQSDALTDKIAKLDARQKDLDGQRLAAIQDAEKLRVQADTATGKKSVDLFTQSAALQKKAADIQAQLEALATETVEAKQDLALAQSQQTQLASAVGALKKQQDEVAKGWTQLQEMIKAHADLSAALLEGGGAAPVPTSQPSADAATEPAAPRPAAAGGASASSSSPAPRDIATASKTMDEWVAAAQKLRDEAVRHLDSAKKALADVAKSNDTLRVAYGKNLQAAELRTYPQTEAWKGMVDLHNASDVQLLQALLAQRYARVYADWATTAAARARTAKLLDAALQPAKLTPPASLKAGSLDDEVANARKLADGAFDDADKLLQTAQKTTNDGPIAKGAKQVAQAMQVIELYAHGQFDAAMGDDKDAATLVSASRSARDAALAANVPLPDPLPAELAPAAPIVGPPTSGPATAPTTTAATEPTTAPTTEATAFGDTTNTTPSTQPAAPATEPAAPDSQPATAPQ